MVGIVSLEASGVLDAPRAPDFFQGRNQLNIAVSRANANC